MGGFARAAALGAAHQTELNTAGGGGSGDEHLSNWSWKLLHASGVRGTSL